MFLFLYNLVSSVKSYNSISSKYEKAKDICERVTYKYSNRVKETKRNYADLSDAVSLVKKSKEELINNSVREFKQYLDILKHTEIFDINA